MQVHHTDSGDLDNLRESVVRSDRLFAYAQFEPGDGQLMCGRRIDRQSADHRDAQHLAVIHVGL